MSKRTFPFLAVFICPYDFFVVGRHPFYHNVVLKYKALYSRICNELECGGTPIGPIDLMIAAIAMAHDLVLITSNTREFGRVVGLEIEDWEEG